MIKDNSKVDDSADRLSFTETLFVANSILPDLTQTKTKENDCYLLFGFAPIFPDICYHLTHYKP
ncbi:TPA: hypothetical protein ACWLW5_004974, partial [Escherichia coli]